MDWISINDTGHFNPFKYFSSLLSTNSFVLNDQTTYRNCKQIRMPSETIYCEVGSQVTKMPMYNNKISVVNNLNTILAADVKIIIIQLAFLS